MIKAKQILSAALAVALTAGIVAANAATSTVTAFAMTNTVNYSQHNFSSDWASLIQQEKQKFPEKVNGKQCYWNGSNQDSYTTTPCAHGWDGSGSRCMFITPSLNFYDCTTYELITEYDSHGEHIAYGQCAGFAAQLQSDIFQTSDMIRLTLDANGYYTTPDGKKVKYYPQRGDSVRINGKHSIFITSTNSYEIKFAQCNADSHCGIDWDQTSYDGQTFTPSNLYKFVTYVDRPMLVGDLNLDGIVNSEDADIFKNTIMKDGSQLGNAPFSAYDADFNNYINEADYKKLMNMSGSAFQGLRYVNSRRGNVTSRWNRVDTARGNFMVNGGIYTTSCNSTGGASFIGTLDTEQTSFSIPNTVKNPEDGITYNVTEVGYAGNRGPNVNRICKLKTVTIPPNVQKIVKYAFYSCALEQINFSNSSTLKSIDEYAFYNSNLTSIVIPTTVETIGAGAFRSCKKLTSFKVAQNTAKSCNLRLIGDYAFKECTSLNEVRIENNISRIIKLGTTNGIFDTSKAVKLYLPNTSSTMGILHLQTEDANKFRNNNLLVYAGCYKINEYNDSSYVNRLCYKTSTSLSRIYPN